MMHAAVLMLVSTCAAQAAQSGAGGDLVVLFVPELEGKLEPCGCSEGQLGGLLRMAALVRELTEAAQTRGAAVLVLSMGDLTGGFGQQARFKAETATAAMDLMGCAAMAVGDRDWFLGPATVQGLAGRATFPFLCGNAQARDGRPRGRAYVTAHLPHGVTARVAGVLSPSCQPSLAALRSGITLGPPEAALRAAFPRGRTQAGFRIVLAHMPQGEAVALGKHVPEADLILAADHDRLPRGEPLTRDGRVVSVAPRGEYIGEVRLTRASGTHMASARAAPVHHALAPDPAVAAVFGEYQKRIREARLLDRVRRRELAKGLRYEGASDCKDCHKAQYAKWRSTEHAHAYETLVKHGRQHDPECAECHVVGLRKQTGFRGPRAKPNLAGVGCECCHGPGNVHGRYTDRPYGRANMPPCERCHDDEHDPRFDSAKAYGKIKHWKQRRSR